MPQQTQAEMFIQTLTEMRDAERKSRDVGLRLDVNPQVQRIMHAFWTDPNDDGHPLNRTLRNQWVE
ncbi:hypothetical protein M8756_16650 [Lutimaribacter sp. EGI FJ00015]|uniref:Uncharacterized protein n=1 Tax=Lutimaribacter degradans TaxID=2945989 RepID=A0ACC5ZZI6_9RHOB|nr:hypothetical protein [Lutimaribacter sp. EGI FJ00013]MCM2563756.1 hypothetical protein [Lutimaribacter sp. EGI FJ00013]MCO0614942.1 hypothetical protein [Lutimaribacter sp. EGI FJ00015]MCO0637578.1 hypothetical protein [Lutimaribacter sp. EGI FJ00014]